MIDTNREFDLLPLFGQANKENATVVHIPLIA